MIWSIFTKEIRIILKDKSTFLWLFVMPILFIIIFSSIFGSTGSTTYSINYYDADRSEQSQQFVQDLEQIQGFKVQEDTSKPLEEQIQAVKDGKQTSLLVIPEGYGQRVNSAEIAEVELYRDAAEDASAAPIIAVLDSVTKQYQEHKLRSALGNVDLGESSMEMLLTPPIQVKEVKENATKVDPVTQIVPGYTVMFVFFIMITMIINMMKDRDSGMLARLQGTPMRAYHYLVGMWLPSIVIVLIQSTVLLTFGHFVYGLHLGDIFAVALIVIALAVCSTGLGLMLSVWVTSENMGIGLVQVIAMGGAITGGLWFPYEFLPKAVQMIGQFTPQYWAQRALQDVMVRGAHISSVWLMITIVFAFGLAGLVVAILRFKRFASKTAG